MEPLTQLQQLIYDQDYDGVREYVFANRRNISQEDLDNALASAVDTQSYVISEFLIEQGADVNADTINGSPLLNAVEKRDIALLRLLLRYGADPNHDLGGIDAYDILIQMPVDETSVQIIDMLLQAGYDVYGVEVEQRFIRTLAEQQFFGKILLEQNAPGLFRHIRNILLMYDQSLSNTQWLRQVDMLLQKINNFNQDDIEFLLYSTGNRDTREKWENILLEAEMLDPQRIV